MEVDRTETKGNTVSEWVQITPAGVDFLHDHESPLRALTDLQDLLRTNQQALPIWLSEMQDEIRQFSNRLGQESERWTRKFEALSRRVAEALHRAEAVGPNLSNGMTTLVPWAPDALAYLDRR